jgi:hypothetical protein
VNLEDEEMEMDRRRIIFPSRMVSKKIFILSKRPKGQLKLTGLKAVGMDF